MTPLPFHIPMGRNTPKRQLTLTITPLGEQKLQKWEGGGLEIRILQILQEEGPTTIGELQKKLQKDENTVRAVCRDMTKNKQWAVAQ